MIYKYLKTAAVLLCLSLSVKAETQPINLTVFKSASCECCQHWVTHAQNAGINIDVKNTDMEQVKSLLGLQSNYRACHTAITKTGALFEGHVPAKFIKQYLEQQPANSIGLVVPAMPLGSPGMDLGSRFMPYQVLLLQSDGTSRVFASINSYEEQF